MVPTNVIIFYVIFFISMICAIFTSSKLYLSGKNYLIAVLAGAMALGEFVVLLSVVWIDDFEKNVPKGFCTFQGLALQYAVYLQIIAAVCFSFHIYQLLINYKQGISQFLQKVYICCLVGGPVVMTICVSIAAIKTDAIRPLALNCDVKSPVWVRLVGYSGFNFALTFPGVYLSSRAAFRVIRHLDRFKTRLSESSNSSTALTSSTTTNSNPEIQITVSTSTETTSYTAYSQPAITQDENALQRQTRAYNLTRSAAIRMVLFSCGFALINVAAAFQTITHVIHGGAEQRKGIGGNDFAGGFMGLMIFAVFGLPNSVKKIFTRKG